MIRTERLGYQYPNSQMIRFPDLNVEKGKALLICGESGCGKTTLLHLLAGLRKPSDGSVKINNKLISALSSAKLDHFRGNNIGMVFQKSHFIHSLSVLENLQISPYSIDAEKARIVAERLEIDELLSRLPKHLSMGQQQRVSIARAVMNEPLVLLADEPTSALDNKSCSKVIDLLQEEAIKHKAALIIVTHDDRLRREFPDCIDLNPFTSF